MSATGKYEVHNQPIDVILAWLTSGEIAIPEIQRPFVWDTTKVRDLLDSLYQGYPIGYLIAWQNPNVRLKDGKDSFGKKVLNRRATTRNRPRRRRTWLANSHGRL